MKPETQRVSIAAPVCLPVKKRPIPGAEFRVGGGAWTRSFAFWGDSMCKQFDAAHGATVYFGQSTVGFVA